MLDEVTINGGRCKRQQARMNAMPDDQEAGEGGGGVMRDTILAIGQTTSLLLLLLLGQNDTDPP